MVTSPEPALKPHRRGIEPAIILALSFVAIIALHGKMQPTVLGAEIGYYQVIAHTSPRHERTLLRGFWTTSSHGHYTPLAFTAEFLFAKHVGLRPNWWRNRQLFLGALLLSPQRLVFVAVVSSLFAVGAIVGHRSYESHVLARTAPLHGASHIQIWRNLVQIAHEARAANLPIPNIPLQSLSGFSFVDFKFLEPLLHDELHLPENEHDSFLDWTECREHRLAEYLTKCPTLLPTAQLLNVDLPNPNRP